MHRTTRRSLLWPASALAFVVLTAWGSRPVLARPGSAPAPSARARADLHADFHRLLRTYVRGGRVDYRRWLARGADRRALGAYLARLAKVDPTTLGRAQRMAFWINAYNAAVLQGVLRELPGNAGFSVSERGFVFFDKRRVRVAGLTLSLNALEHGVLRGAYGHKSVRSLNLATVARIRTFHRQVLAPGQRYVDPRIHFALVCAARGCPDLRAGVYRGARLEAQLAAQTRAYVNNAAKGANSRGISSLFHWFAQDFTRTHGTVARFLARYYRGDVSRLALAKQIPYSWTLNSR